MRVLATAMAMAALVPGLFMTPSALADGSAVVDRGFVHAVETQLQTQPPIDLTEYAVGDGATPDGAAINQAVKDAAASGRPLYAPAGRTFMVDQTILLPSGLTLFGDGVFKASVALGDRPVMLNADFAAGNDRIALIGITVDGNRAARGNPGPTAHGIWLHGGDDTPVTHVLVRDVKVHDAPMLGFPMQNVQDAVVERLESYGHGRDGLTFYFNSRRIEILSPYIHDCGDDLIGLNGEDGTSNGHRLEDILIDSPRLAGQHSQGSGIAVHGARRVTIKNAAIDGSFHAALSVGNWNRTPAEDVTVAGLVATDPGRFDSGGSGHGVEMYAGADNRSLAGTAGVHGVSITGLDIKNPRGQGVGLYGAAGAEISDVAIQGRIAGGNLYSQSRGITSSTGFVNRLTLQLDISGMPAEGIRLHGGTTPVRNLVIRNSHVSGNGRDHASAGIDLDGIDGLTIEDTTSTGQAWGILANAISGSSAIRRTDVRGNSSGGLRLRGGGGVKLVGLQGAAGDTGSSALGLHLRAPRVQTAARHGAVTVLARCSGACSAHASGKLVVARRTVTLKAASKQLRAGHWTRLTLTASQGSRAALNRTLGRRGVAGKLQVRLRAGGGTQALKRAVSLR